jgi:hypothetical protein
LSIGDVMADSRLSIQHSVAKARTSQTVSQHNMFR